MLPHAPAHSFRIAMHRDAFALDGVASVEVIDMPLISGKERGSEQSSPYAGGGVAEIASPCGSPKRKPYLWFGIVLFDIAPINH